MIKEFLWRCSGVFLDREEKEGIFLDLVKRKWKSSDGNAIGMLPFKI